jgi:hypothetical protein
MNLSLLLLQEDGGARNTGLDKNKSVFQSPPELGDLGG